MAQCEATGDVSELRVDTLGAVVLDLSGRGAAPGALSPVARVHVRLAPSAARSPGAATAAQFSREYVLPPASYAARLEYGPLTVAGECELAVMVDGAHARGSPFRLAVRPGALAPARCALVASEAADEHASAQRTGTPRAALVIAGRVGEATILCRDRHGNMCNDAAAAPFEAWLLPVPSARRMGAGASADGWGDEHAAAGGLAFAQSAAAAAAADAALAAARGVEQRVWVSPGSAGLARDGHVAVRFTRAVAGEYHLHARLLGEPVGQPLRVRVVASDVYAAACSIESAALARVASRSGHRSGHARTSAARRAVAGAATRDEGAIALSAIVAHGEAPADGLTGLPVGGVRWRGLWRLSNGPANDESGAPTLVLDVPVGEWLALLVRARDLYGNAIETGGHAVTATGIAPLPSGSADGGHAPATEGELLCRVSEVAARDGARGASGDDGTVTADKVTLGMAGGVPLRRADRAVRGGVLLTGARDGRAAARAAGGHAREQRAAAPSHPQLRAAVDGLLEVRVCATRTGVYRLDIRIGDAGMGGGAPSRRAPICGAPLTVRAMPSARDARSTRAVGAGLERARAGDEATFRVEWLDFFNFGAAEAAHAAAVRVRVRAALPPSSAPAQRTTDAAAASSGASRAACPCDWARTRSDGGAGAGTCEDQAGEQGALLVATVRREARLDGDSGAAGAGALLYSFTPTVACMHEVHVDVGGLPIDGSPFSLRVEPGPTAPARCEVLGLSGGELVAGEWRHCTVVPRDSHGNRRAGGGDVASLRVSPPAGAAGTVLTRAEQRPDGAHALALCVPTAGEVEVAVLVNGHEVGGASGRARVRVSAAEPDARETRLVDTRADSWLASTEAGALPRAGALLSPRAVLRADEPVAFALCCRDRFGNVVHVGGASVVASCASCAHAPRARDCGDGSYAVELTPVLVGAFELRVTVGGADVRGSPAHVRVTSGRAVGARSSALGVGLANALAGEPTTIEVATADGAGNACEEGGAAVRCTIYPVRHGHRGKVLTVTDHKNGRYAVTYAAPVSGGYELHLSVDAQPIIGSPFALSVTQTREGVERGPAPGAPAPRARRPAPARRDVLQRAADRPSSAAPGGARAPPRPATTGAAPSGCDLSSDSARSVLSPRRASRDGASPPTRAADAPPAGPLHPPTCIAEGPGVAREVPIGARLLVRIRARDREGCSRHDGVDTFRVSVRRAASEAGRTPTAHAKSAGDDTTATTACVEPPRPCVVGGGGGDPTFGNVARRPAPARVRGCYECAYMVSAAGRYILAITARDGERGHTRHVAGSPFVVEARARARSPSGVERARRAPAVVEGVDDQRAVLARVAWAGAASPRPRSSRQEPPPQPSRAHGAARGSPPRAARGAWPARAASPAQSARGPASSMQPTPRRAAPPFEHGERTRRHSCDSASMPTAERAGSGAATPASPARAARGSAGSAAHGAWAARASAPRVQARHARVDKQADAYAHAPAQRRHVDRTSCEQAAYAVSRLGFAR